MHRRAALGTIVGIGAMAMATSAARQPTGGQPAPRVVEVPALGVVHAGDIFSGKNIPLLDAVNGGSGLEIGDTLATAASNLGNVESIIPGHSTVMSPADLREYANFNKDFAEAVRAAKKAGKTVDKIAKSWTIPAKYEGYAAPAEVRLRSNVQIVFDEVR
jgi:hypothetical protein